MKVDIADLGLRPEDIIERIAEHIRYQLTEETGFAERVRKSVEKKVDAEFAGRIAPSVAARVEAMTFRQTNKWGEKRGEPMTFTEFCAATVEAWLSEPVDMQGRPSQSMGRGETRLLHAVHQMLAFRIEKEVQKALADMGQKLADDVMEAVRQVAAKAKPRITGV